MADRADLDAAAQAGVIRTDQVGPLHDFLVARKGAPARPAALTGEEDLRFIRNFHDVFLAIGILLFAIGLAVAIGTYAAGVSSPQQQAVTVGVLCLGAVAAMWGLGEVFARRRRLFLPAIAIVCALTAFAVVAVGMLYAGAVVGQNYEGPVADIEGMPPALRNGILVALSFAVIAPLAFYLRFRLPFSLGLTGAGAALFIVVAFLIANFDAAVPMLPALNLVLGALLFAAGVAFDARDPERVTRFSDNGFWLHFAAAPLILNGAFGLIGQLLIGGDWSAGSGTGMMIQAQAGGAGTAAIQAGATLFVVAILGVVSLLINRRALIVSALLTTGVAIGVLLNAAGLGAGSLAAATLITLGAFVLILGAGWHSVRRALLSSVKPDGVWARIFPPEAPAAT